MDTVHWHLLEVAFVAGAPFLFAAFATALAWRAISHRALYAIVSLFFFWGLDEFLYPLVALALNPTRTGSAAYPGAMFWVLAATATLVAVIGFPILWRLRIALRRA